MDADPRPIPTDSAGRGGQELVLRSEDLQAILDVTQRLAADEVDAGRFLTAVCEHAARLTRADGAAVELVDGPELVYRAGSTPSAAQVGLRLAIGTSLSGEAVRTGRPLSCEDWLLGRNGGGEEFAWLMPGVDREGAAVAAERGCAEVRALALHGVGSLTISAGVAELTGTAGGEQLVAQADRALYRAKDLGRDRVAA